MSTLQFCKKKMPGIPAGKHSLFPALRDPIASTIDSKLSEEDGLFVNYGMFSDSLPYAMLDDYDMNQRQELEFDCAVLENEHLRAEFILPLGGRLWSLYDKDQKRDLITNNTEFRPCNLAIRNAWFAGGVEYNCARRGHDANTCEPRFAAELHDPEYGPVLRIYDYSRDRKVPFQMDFFLPDGSRFLFLRGRIYNPNKAVVPMYWWSNIAASLTPGCRVVVPAAETYLNKYVAGSHFISRVPMPDGEGFDQTYPENFHFVRDHFYDIPEHSRKYESLINKDGTGFIHLSTRRLQGRKLFVWGKTTGGDNWQRKLLGPGVCEYLELQGGLAKTQQECLPMPPETAWEWLEAYGGITVAPEDVFGSWERAMASVTAWADKALPEPLMDEMLAKTKERMAKQPGTLRCQGLGFGALEEFRSGRKLSPHLDFGKPGDEQQEWVHLLETKKVDEEPPRSFSVDPDYLELLEKGGDSWKKHYHLALYFFRQRDWERALKYARQALVMNRNAWTLHVTANVLLRSTQETKLALACMAEAARRPEADAYLVKECFKLLVIHRNYDEVLALYADLPEKERRRPNIRAHYAAALFYTGKAQQALDVLLNDGPLDLTDVREGESFLTKLYLEIQHALGNDDAEKSVPLSMDFRTN